MSRQNGNVRRSIPLETAKPKPTFAEVLHATAVKYMVNNMLGYVEKIPGIDLKETGLLVGNLVTHAQDLWKFEVGINLKIEGKEYSQKICIVVFGDRSGYMSTGEPSEFPVTMESHLVKDRDEVRAAFVVADIAQEFAERINEGLAAVKLQEKVQADKLGSLEIKPFLINWLQPFLTEQVSKGLPGLSVTNFKIVDIPGTNSMIQSYQVAVEIYDSHKHITQQHYVTVVQDLGECGPGFPTNGKSIWSEWLNPEGPEKGFNDRNQRILRDIYQRVFNAAANWTPQTAAMPERYKSVHEKNAQAMDALIDTAGSVEVFNRFVHPITIALGDAVRHQLDVVMGLTGPDSEQTRSHPINRVVYGVKDGVHNEELGLRSMQIYFLIPAQRVRPYGSLFAQQKPADHLCYVPVFLELDDKAKAELRSIVEHPNIDIKVFSEVPCTTLDRKYVQPRPQRDVVIEYAQLGKEGYMTTLALEVLEELKQIFLDNGLSLSLDLPQQKELITITAGRTREDIARTSVNHSSTALTVRGQAMIASAVTLAQGIFQELHDLDIKVNQRRPTVASETNDLREQTAAENAKKLTDAKAANIQAALENLYSVLNS